MSATIRFLDFLHWARQIHIDHVVAHLHQNQSGLRHLIRVRPHHLPRDRVVIQSCDHVVLHFTKSAFTGDQIRILFAPTFAAVDQRLIKQRFGDAKRSAVTPRNQAHGAIAVAGKARLKKRRIKSGNRGGNARVNLVLTRKVRRHFKWRARRLAFWF